MRFDPNWESIKKHQVPTWYEDAKIGIFIHWGLYSVPAWATPICELGAIPTEEWMKSNPYAEWYYNSLRIKESPTCRHHAETYGEDFPYEKFTELWKAENWDPAAWAKLFRQAGAQYVIPTTKHHDGFCLWNSDYTDYNTAKRGPQRDIVRELSDAVRAEGMRFGVYYSGILDWRFTKQPILTDYDLRHPENCTYAYADYAYNQARELIDKYQPSVLWNDIGWPYKGEGDLPYLLSYYYNAVPEGIINDRWNGLWCDYTTKEYGQGDKHVEWKWEACRGLGLSFGYNQIEDDTHLLSKNGFISLMIDTVAHNGNLLINVGPRADGTIPENQASRLLYLGDWLAKNGEAIYGTRLYERQSEALESGETVYFTRKGETVYLLIDTPKAGESTVRIAGLGGAAGSVCAVSEIAVSASAEGDDLCLTLSGVPAESAAVVVKCKA